MPLSPCLVPSPPQCLRPRPPPELPWLARLMWRTETEAFSFSLPPLEPGQQRTLHLQVGGRVGGRQHFAGGLFRKQQPRAPVSNRHPPTCPPGPDTAFIPRSLSATEIIRYSGRRCASLS